MIDIHSHVLYGLDDGAATLEDSVAMLKLAAASGTTAIVATPHSNSEFVFQPDLIAQRLSEVSAAVGDSIRISTGCDFHLQYDNIQDALRNTTRYTINHKSYLLVEFSDLTIFNTTGAIFQQFRDAGILPIITHPERNWLLQQRFEQLGQWVEEGCYIQVTAHSFLGRFGRHAKEYADKLMKRGLVHFVASDAHDSQDRTPDLRAAWTYVEEKYGRQRAEELFITNPRAALEGRTIEITPMDAPPEPRKWYRFWA